MKIMEEIEMIVGKQIRIMGRAGDMMWLSIGKTIKVTNFRGEERSSGTHAIHLQCPWRIRSFKTILFTSQDIYQPASTEKDDENFNWDVQGKNLFDEKAKNWLKKGGNIIIKEVKIGRFGDLQIGLSNQDILEVFVNKRINECWRFFECGTNLEHLVVTGKGVLY